MSGIHSYAEVTRRRPIYADVESLVSPGFLTSSFEVGGIVGNMRSLGPGDYFLIRHRLPPKTGTMRLWKEWCVASSIWMLDGQILLEDANAPVRVRTALQGMSKSTLDILFSIHTGLYNRVSKAANLCAAFCYEDFSRDAWRSLGKGHPSRDEVVGIGGVGSLGLNYIQRMWMSYNQAEDDRMVMLGEWGAAKLVASATNGAGVKKLNQREEGDRKREEERREEVIAEAYCHVTGQLIGEREGRVMIQAVTQSDLIEEMERTMRGEKDYHDLMVDAYKNQIRERQIAAKEAHAARMLEVETMMAEEMDDPDARTVIVGYSKEQIRELNISVGGATRGRGASTTVVDASHPSILYDRYLAKDVQVGAIDPRGVARPMSDEKGGEKTLTEKLANRLVRIHDTEEED